MPQPPMRPASTQPVRIAGLPGPLLLLLNWLLPGVGWFLAGRWQRGAAQSILVLLTFGLGLGLHAGVTWPAWAPSSPEFNLINNFTFLIQLGAGALALISLAAQQLGNPLLGGIASHAWFELGSYYLVVAGGVNYFATMNLHDRLLARPSRFDEQERPRATEPMA